MRTILITGASGGLIQAMVPLLKEDYLILLGRDREKIERLYAAHPRKWVADVDIRDEAALAAFIDQVESQHGPIDILVNNAGYARYGAFEQFTSREVEEMFAINLFALMTLSRLVGRRMKERRQGLILSIVSMSGHLATAQSSVYSASKFAALGFSNAIRLELAPYNVQVTTVNPGPVATGFFDLADPDGSYQERVKAFLLQPEKVTRVLVRAMNKRPREVNLPFSLALVRVVYTLFPNLCDYLARTAFDFKK